MAKVKKIVLKITPKTWVRVTANDRWFFRIPFDKLKPSGQKRKLRLEAYNQYKIDLLAEAKRLNFQLPYIGAGVIFCVPVPKSWSQKKKKLHHGKWHNSRPDLKNLLSAFEDALMSEDKEIAYYSHLGKVWVNAEEGWIEVRLFDSSRIFIEPPSVEGENSLL